MLSRNSAWIRHFSLALTSSYSLYLAIFSHFLPWTNYFNMFANLIYLTSLWTGNSNETSQLSDFIGLETEQLS